MWFKSFANIYILLQSCNTFLIKVLIFLCFSTLPSMFFLFRMLILRTFVSRNKTNKTMGLGTYWARKDDQTDELKTVKPWEEEVSNGDKFFPDPHQKEQEDSEKEDSQ